jgi:hypothetical protein
VDEDDTASDSEEYRGHELEVTAYLLRRGVWEWTYTVDGNISGMAAPRATCPTAAAALARAMSAAKVRVDQG